MSNIGEIAVYMTHFRDQLKFYHWATKDYARHIASDTLVLNITTNLDTIIETLQGSENKRLILPSNKLSFSIENDASMVNELKRFRDWLINKFPKLIKTNNTDLLNIRDTILSDVNKTLYLFTLK